MTIATIALVFIILIALWILAWSLCAAASFADDRIETAELQREVDDGR